MQLLISLVRACTSHAELVIFTTLHIHTELYVQDGLPTSFHTPACVFL